MEIPTEEPIVEVPQEGIVQAVGRFQQSPMMILPEQWAVKNSAVDNLKIFDPPPAIPRWYEPDTPRHIVGTAKHGYLFWTEKHNLFKTPKAYGPVYLQPIFVQPFYKIVDADGRVLTADQYLLSDPWAAELCRLSLSFNLLDAFHTEWNRYLLNFKKFMYASRCARRTWELKLLAAVTDNGKYTSVLARQPVATTFFDDAKKWVEGENAKDRPDIEEWWYYGHTTGPLGITIIPMQHCRGSNWIKHEIPPATRNLTWAVRSLKRKMSRIEDPVEEMDTGDDSSDDTCDADDPRQCLLPARRVNFYRWVFSRHKNWARKGTFKDATLPSFNIPPLEIVLSYDAYDDSYWDIGMKGLSEPKCARPLHKECPWGWPEKELRKFCLEQGDNLLSSDLYYSVPFNELLSIFEEWYFDEIQDMRDEEIIAGDRLRESDEYQQVMAEAELMIKTFFAADP